MVPTGYERLLLPHAVAVARSDLAPGIRRALIRSDGSRATLHEYAASRRDARPLAGRGTAYAVRLPESDIPVVVRHNHRGGLLRAIKGDRFLAPTRAPHELDVSLRLRREGVRTPEVLAYALYPPGSVIQRSDVITREVPGGRDLAAVMMKGDRADRDAALAATVDLLAALSRAGARHHDLNARNVLLASEGAYVLDVDRVELGGTSAETLERNVARLTRSLEKWREQFGATIGNEELDALGTSARRAVLSS
jgi:tRNA A-37 threonylcarbamoyl transferase component Bud32